jgi:hypothetical protein
MMRLTASAIAGMMIFISVSQFLSCAAMAALGEKEASVESDRNALSATLSGVRVHARYSVHEIKTGSTVVREYLNKDGVVFGLAWRGRTHPDLSVLLGNYSGEYQQAVSAPQRGPRVRGGHRMVQGSHVVVERSGHMNSLRGRAYLPSMLPAGVRPNEIN